MSKKLNFLIPSFAAPPLFILRSVYVPVSLRPLSQKSQLSSDWSAVKGLSTQCFHISSAGVLATMAVLEEGGDITT